MKIQLIKYQQYFAEAAQNIGQCVCIQICQYSSNGRHKDHNVIRSTLLRIMNTGEFRQQLLRYCFSTQPKAPNNIGQHAKLHSRWSSLQRGIMAAKSCPPFTVTCNINSWRTLAGNNPKAILHPVDVCQDATVNIECRMLLSYPVAH